MPKYPEKKDIDKHTEQLRRAIKIYQSATRVDALDRVMLLEHLNEVFADVTLELMNDERTVKRSNFEEFLRFLMGKSFAGGF